MESLIQLTDGYRAERAALQVQLDMIESGRLFTGDQFRTGSVDTTCETKAELQGCIAEWDALITEYDPRLR